MMKYISKLFLLLLLPSVFIWSCNSDYSCRQDTEVSLSVNFYQPKRDDAKQKLVMQPLNDTIKIYGLGQDSLLYVGKNISSARLPLKPFDDMTLFVVQKDSLMADTLRFSHTNEEFFLSVECGVVYHHTLTSVFTSFNSIDSVSIINPKVIDNQTQGQVKIYFKAE